MDNSFLTDIQNQASVIEAQNWGSLAYFYILNNAKNLVIDGRENFVKASYRNRYEVCGPNGKATLSIHLQKGRSQRRHTKNVDIFYGEDWQRLHWFALCSNYRRSPYFEYYEDDLEPIFKEKTENLFELNIKTIEFIKEQLDLQFELKFTETPIPHKAEGYLDLRTFIRPNKPLPNGLQFINERKYHQVFEDRNPFFPNLSILDALFNLGPRTVELLKP